MHEIISKAGVDTAERQPRCSAAVTSIKARLSLVSEDCSAAVRNALATRCLQLNDPQRAIRLLLNSHVSKRVFIAAPLQHEEDIQPVRGHCVRATDSVRLSESLEEARELLKLASVAEVLVIYNIRPGRSSYSVFVEASPGGNDTVPSPSSRTEEGLPYSLLQYQQPQHQARLFQAALYGILTLPPSLGPGRLAFSGVPGHGAAAMLAGLREAGYDNVWDEPCFRYYLTAAQAAALPAIYSESLQATTNAAAAATTAAAAAPTVDAVTAISPLTGEKAARARLSASAPPEGSQTGRPEGEIGHQPLPYVVDALRSEADVQIVNRHWTYRSPYSLPLVRLLVQHGRTVCMRLRPLQLQLGAAGAHGRGGAGSATAHSAAAAAAEEGGGRVSSADPTAPDSADASLRGSADPTADRGRSGSDAVAWILQYPDGALGLAHTLAGHRRRGLVRRCVVEMVRQLLLPALPPHPSPPPESTRKVEAEREGRGPAARDGVGRATTAAAVICGAVASCNADDGVSARIQQQQQQQGGRPEEPDEVFTYIVRENTASITLFESLRFRCSSERYHWLGVMGSRQEEGEEEEEEEEEHVGGQAGKEEKAAED